MAPKEKLNLAGDGTGNGSARKGPLVTVVQGGASTGISKAQPPAEKPPLEKEAKAQPQAEQAMGSNPAKSSAARDAVLNELKNNKSESALLAALKVFPMVCDSNDFGALLAIVVSNVTLKSNGDTNIENTRIRTYSAIAGTDSAVSQILLKEGATAHKNLEEAVRNPNGNIVPNILTKLCDTVVELELPNALEILGLIYNTGVVYSDRVVQTAAMASMEKLA
jgi:hypothetical protein